MANSDKNIVITPARGSSTDDPKIVFSGADSSTAAQNVTAKIYPTSNGTLSIEGSSGQLLAITNNSSGVIYSVNDISGIPAIQVQESGDIKLAPYGGNVSVTGTLRGIDATYGINTGSGTANTTWVKIATMPAVDCSATIELTYSSTESNYFHDGLVDPYNTSYLTAGYHSKYLLTFSSSIGTGGYYGYTVRLSTSHIAGSGGEYCKFALCKNADNTFDVYINIEIGISSLDLILSYMNIATIVNNNCVIYRNNFTATYTLPGTQATDYQLVGIPDGNPNNTFYDSIYYYYNYWYGGGFGISGDSFSFKNYIFTNDLYTNYLNSYTVIVNNMIYGYGNDFYLRLSNLDIGWVKLNLNGDINLAGDNSYVGAPAAAKYTGIVIPRKYSQTGGTSGPTFPSGDGLRRYDLYTYNSVSSNFTLTADPGNANKSTYEGQKILIRIKATASITITLGSGGTYPWRQIVTVPTSMVNGDILYIGAVFNSTDGKWDIIAAKKGS